MLLSPPPQLLTLTGKTASSPLASEAEFRAVGDKPIEKWEIYAWAVRDIMSRASGLPKVDV